MQHWNIGTLTTVLQPLVKADTGQRILIREMWFTNHGGSNTSFHAMIQKSGEAQDNGFYIIKGEQLRSGTGGTRPTASR